MADKQLILTADDFGRSPAVNDAVLRWHRAGALTHASLMVNEPHAEAAGVLARGMPGLHVGLHLVLCDGIATGGRTMQRSPALAGLRFAFMPGARAWLQREISAQFEKFRAFGFSGAHWDGHTHLHLHPVVLGITLPIALAHGFKFTRLVREPGPAALLPWIFQKLSSRAIPRLRAVGIGFADRVFGLRKTGRMDRDEFERTLSCSGTGTTEIYFHPGAESSLPEPEWVAAKLRELRLQTAG